MMFKVMYWKDNNRKELLGISYVRAKTALAASSFILERGPLPSHRRARAAHAIPWAYQTDPDFKRGSIRISEMP